MLLLLFCCLCGWPVSIEGSKGVLPCVDSSCAMGVSRATRSRDEESSVFGEAGALPTVETLPGTEEPDTNVDGIMPLPDSPGTVTKGFHVTTESHPQKQTTHSREPLPTDTTVFDVPISDLRHPEPLPIGTTIYTVSTSDQGYIETTPIETAEFVVSTNDLIHPEPLPIDTTNSDVSANDLIHSEPLSITDTTNFAVSTSDQTHPEPLSVDTTAVSTSDLRYPESFPIDTTHFAVLTSDLIHLEPLPTDTTNYVISTSDLSLPEPLPINTTISVVSTSVLSHPEPLSIDTKVSVVSTQNLGDTESLPSDTLLSTNKSDVATSSTPSLPFPLTHNLQIKQMDSQIHEYSHNKNTHKITENPSNSISKEAIPSRQKATSGALTFSANQKITSKLEEVETSLQGTISTTNASTGSLAWNTDISSVIMDSSTSSNITSMPDQSDTQPQETMELPARLQNNGVVIAVVGFLVGISLLAIIVVACYCVKTYRNAKSTETTPTDSIEIRSKPPSRFEFLNAKLSKQRTTSTTSTTEAPTLLRDGSDSYEARNTNSNIYQYVTHGSRGIGQRPKRVTSYTDSIIDVYSEIDLDREDNGKGIRGSYPIYEDPNKPDGAPYGFLKRTSGMNKGRRANVIAEPEYETVKDVDFYTEVEYADYNDTNSSIYTEVKFPTSFNRGFGVVNSTTRHYKSISKYLTQRDSQATNKSSTAKSEIKYLDLVESVYSCEVPQSNSPGSGNDNPDQVEERV